MLLLLLLVLSLLLLLLPPLLAAAAAVAAATAASADSAAGAVALVGDSLPPELAAPAFRTLTRFLVTSFDGLPGNLERPILVVRASVQMLTMVELAAHSHPYERTL